MFEQLRAEDPPLIGSYKTVSRIAEADADGVTYLAKSAGGRDVTVVLLARPLTDQDRDGALQTGRHGTHDFVARPYSGPPLPQPEMRKSRDRAYPVMLIVASATIAMSVFAVGWVVYTIATDKPLSRSTWHFDPPTNLGEESRVAAWVSQDGRTVVVTSEDCTCETRAEVSVEDGDEIVRVGIKLIGPPGECSTAVHPIDVTVPLRSPLAGRQLQAGNGAPYPLLKDAPATHPSVPVRIEY